jgi:hypothetical protein
MPHLTAVLGANDLRREALLPRRIRAISVQSSYNPHTDCYVRGLLYNMGVWRKLANAVVFKTTSLDGLRVQVPLPPTQTLCVSADNRCQTATIGDRLDQV